MITIGFLELNSIAKGILAADMMLKAAEIRSSACRFMNLKSAEERSITGDMERDFSLHQRHLMQQIMMRKKS